MCQVDITVRGDQKAKAVDENDEVVGEPMGNAASTVKTFRPHLLLGCDGAGSFVRQWLCESGEGFAPIIEQSDAAGVQYKILKVHVANITQFISVTSLHCIG